MNYNLELYSNKVISENKKLTIKERIESVT